jgi:hypothetical protein
MCGAVENPVRSQKDAPGMAPKKAPVRDASAAFYCKVIVHLRKFQRRFIPPTKAFRKCSNLEAYSTAIAPMPASTPARNTDAPGPLLVTPNGLRRR